ncbi:MAG: alpha/beta hydrolase [Aureispira sp.]|nr:alpha/beta hydrolase [Aureispira sp.]
MKTSKFKNTKETHQFIQDWAQQVQANNSTSYQSVWVDTRYGKTHLFKANNHTPNAQDLIFFPGFRTSGLFWDANDTIKTYTSDFNVWLLDVIGQPTLSSPKSPLVKGDGYGQWLNEILEQLHITKANIVGTSFGAQLVVKLANAAPEKIIKAAMLAPASFAKPQPSFSIIWGLIKGTLFPTRTAAAGFLNPSLTPETKLATQAKELLVDFIHHMMHNYTNKAQYPYKSPDQELNMLKAPTLVLIGEHDVIFNTQAVIDRAQSVLPNLVEAEILKDLGHGLELSAAVADRVHQFLIH